MLEVDCEMVAGGWGEAARWAALAERAVGAALAGDGRAFLLASEGLVEVAVRLTDDTEVRQLNHNYRHKDRPTNILSFPMLAADDVAGALQARSTRNGELHADLLLGDLALAYETTAAEAAEQGIRLADHVGHLLVHGTLHLLGHDHADDATAAAMEALEIRILAGLGIANPYAGPYANQDSGHDSGPANDRTPHR